jgi:hypothetical protein
MKKTDPSDPQEGMAGGTSKTADSENAPSIFHGHKGGTGVPALVWRYQEGFLKE